MSSAVPAPVLPLAGRVLGRYRVTAVVGRGGMGSVCVGEHLDTGARVALKVLHAELSRDGETVQRFLREARLVQAVRHPNIIELVDQGVEGDGTPYLVLELLTGESLAERLGRGRFDEAMARRVGAQVALALEAAHTAGVIHRDLKPENVFLCAPAPGEGAGDGQEAVRVKLLDFGIARLQEYGTLEQRLTQTGSLLGTPLYMSPEQIESDEEVGPASDVYALGCLLHEMVSGQTPFPPSRNVAHVLKGHLLDAPPALASVVPSISADYEELTLRCLEKRTADRPAPAGHVARVLEGTEALPARAPRIFTPRRSPARAGDLDPALLRAGLAETLAISPSGAQATLSMPPPASAPAPARRVRRRVWTLIGAAGGALLVAGLFLGARSLRRPGGRDGPVGSLEGCFQLGWAGGTAGTGLKLVTARLEPQPGGLLIHYDWAGGRLSLRREEPLSAGGPARYAGQWSHAETGNSGEAQLDLDERTWTGGGHWTSRATQRRQAMLLQRCRQRE